MTIQKLKHIIRHLPEDCELLIFDKDDGELILLEDLVFFSAIKEVHMRVK